MLNFKSRFAAAAIASIFTFTVPAGSAQRADHPLVHKLWHATYDVESDGRVTQTVEQEVQVLQENALEDAKRQSISFSTSTQTGDVLAAYTLKADGRKLPVPAGNYQKTTNNGRGNAGPLFSDRTSLSVVFPDVGLGDSVHIRYRIVDKEAMFPGQFSMAMSFSPFTPYDDARITVHLPKGMVTLNESHLLEAVAPAEKAGKRVLEWRYANSRPRAWSEEEDSGLWSLEETPSVLLSTFPTYEAIAKAYGDRALPKALPTPRIRELAAQVVGKATDPREKARLLYEWVSRNITYGGNCIGVGAVVPRDLEVVLANKMGDCKDHATLLQALLSAGGIRSEQVLINAGSTYELAKTPVVSLVNHVMNFLPEFNLYLDATAKDIPFGYLPDGTYGKPVIHVRADKALAVVPAIGDRETRQRLTMQLKLAEGGSATGEMQVIVAGEAAASMRSYMRNLTANDERDFVKRALSSYGFRGKGVLTKDDPQALADSYQWSVKFEIDNFLRSASTGAWVLAPVMGSPMPVMRFAGYDEAPASRRRQVCSGFRSSETYAIELPPGMTLLSIPEDAQVHGSMVDYVATYAKTPTGMTVTRDLHDKTVGGICSPEVMNAFHSQAVLVGANLRSQMLYKRKLN